MPFDTKSTSFQFWRPGNAKFSEADTFHIDTGMSTCEKAVSRFRSCTNQIPRQRTGFSTARNRVKKVAIHLSEGEGIKE